MSEPPDRLDAIQKVYLDALQHEPDDLAGAQTASDVTAIQANLAKAKATYYSAVAQALSANSADVEKAYVDVETCRMAVQEARTAEAEIADLLGALNKATGAADTLLRLATGT